MATLTRKRRNPAKSRQFQQEALSRAVSGLSVANYAAIYDGFMAMGIPEEAIIPRRNVFTFAGFKALGRYVRKGEHGVKINTWIEGTRENKQGKTEAYKFCRTTTVFHISQTEAIDSSPSPVAIAGYLEYHPQA